ncbi:MAG: NAD(P)H-dependent oxidoreductase subunit E [Bacteroidales bacterium]|nr:NAD(P)H-dependent oxidoreductase subunit E [Bacteroidales bacterium]
METIVENELVRELANTHGRTRESLIPTLQDLVVHKRFLSRQDMVDVARELDISAADVFGTATFYTFLDTEPRGKYIIRICKTISCAMKGKNEILSTIEEILKLNLGETTPDRKFSLLEANCIGWCHKAPAMLINDTPYTDLTPKIVTEILREYIKK